MLDVSWSLAVSVEVIASLTSVLADVGIKAPINSRNKRLAFYVLNINTTTL